jgi:hypothetical protein
MRARRRSTDGRAYCLAKPDSLETYLLSQHPLARQACWYSPRFARQPGEPPSDFAQNPLAGLEPLRAAFCIRRRDQSKNQRRGGAERGAHKRKFSQICLPGRLNTLANAKGVSADLQS